MSIRSKLTILLISVSLLPIIALTIHGVFTTIAQTERDTIHSNETDTIAVQMEIDAMIQGALDSIKQLARNPLIISMDPAKIRPILISTLPIHRDVSLLAVVNPQGMQLARSNNTPLNNVAHRYYYQTAMKGYNEVVSEVMVSLADQRLVTVVATPIRDDNQIIGVVQASVDLKRLHEFVISKTRPGHKVFIIGSDGKLLAHPNYAMILPKDRVDLSATSYIKEAISGKVGSVKTTDLRNEPVLLSYDRHQKTGWIICSETPYAMITAESNRQTFFRLLIGLIILGIVAIISLFVAARFARPIVSLTAHAERIAEGSLLSEKVIVPSRDEVGKMAAAFQKMLDYLFHYAYYDLLTGLTNRKYFINKLEPVLAGCDARDCGGAVFFLDIDNFKAINDSFGHSFGDSILKEIGTRLTETCPGILISRLGGDEFVLLVDDATDRQEIAGYARRIITELRRPLEFNGNEFLLTASLGIAVYPEHGNDVETILKHADIAMYKAKDNGRNRCEFYTELLSQDHRDHFNMESDLKKAISNEEIVIYYQPQYNLRHKKLIGFEALIRWNSSKFGFLYPTHFIPLAERTGLISEIGEWTFREICLFAKNINTGRTEPLCISVNISAIQLMQSDFTDTITEIVRESGVNPEFIGIEITESTLLNYFDVNYQKVKYLKDMGMKVSLDDFGTGYSSLSYLRKLPVSIIKIDKTFVDDINRDEKYLKIVKAIINISHELDLQVIAEGVETQDQFDLLAKLKCDFVQGYFLEKPVPESVALRMAK